ncbi:MAG: class I SAM-dependent methyltransferase [Candidatus Levybacteria bacterium]|nr:class I SAM-dependent methyltransferase [Candidatus Levybacteria bacterium]
MLTTVNNLIEIKKCRICEGAELFDVIDLGDQPIPNGFLSKKDLTKKEPRYPLIVCFCSNCSLLQLRYLVNPEVMFKNYLYIPSSSKTRVEHFRKLAESMNSIIKLDDKSLVIDIGSNDGSLLICFRNLGVRVLGIDPAENLVKIAALNGIETIRGYFDSKLALKTARRYGKAKIILSTNTIAHIPNLHEALKGVSVLMGKEGIFVMQFPYVMDLLDKNLFDTIYHEHLSYFSLKSLLKLSEKSELEIFDIERNDLDGGAIRVFWKRKAGTLNKVNKKNINRILEEEKKYGLYEKKTYSKFADRIKTLKITFLQKISDLKKNKKKIVGYGAAAKANVLLNYFGLDTKTIDYIVDSTPYKQGLFTPGTHIPIYSEDKIYNTIPDYVLIFAWNFSKEIIQKNKKYKDNGGKFILAEPKLQII